jgi:crotonobetainyl-CoA:carnitine CoA-transferase CaiB-like acyl-CoA transferase
MARPHTAQQWADEACQRRNEMSVPLPLEGVRVLAFSQFGAGPFATLNLADMGAEVIKIEDPSTGGEVSRFVPPYTIANDSLYFQAWNRNKRSLTLNVRRPEGMAVFADLVTTADIVFNNLRGNEPAKLGLNYRHLCKMNPRIVCCSLNGFGSCGDSSADPGYDYLMQAAAGYMSLTGDPAGPPVACGVSFIDHAAGFAAAMATVTALYAAQQTGMGRDVEVSLLDTAYSMLTYLAIWNMNRGFKPRRYQGSAHQTLVPVQTFRTRDGFITIFCGKDKFWRILCEAFDDAELASDPRFSTFKLRFQNRDLVIERVQGHFLQKTTSEWLIALRGKVPCAPVRDLTTALADPDLEERGTIITVEHPTFGVLKEVNTPARFSGSIQKHSHAPSLGEDTVRILKHDLGYPDERIDALQKAKII